MRSHLLWFSSYFQLIVYWQDFLKMKPTMTQLKKKVLPLFLDYTWIACLDTSTKGHMKAQDINFIRLLCYF
jgi:hypothetical protein